MNMDDIKEAIEVLEDASAEMLIETGDKDYYSEAIAILRQAIEQAEQSEPVARKPLTDERVWDAYMQTSAEFDCNAIDLVEFARAIEAAHGIGENVDGVTISEERVDEMVKTEHDKQIEIAQAYQRGWNAALAQQEPVAWINKSRNLLSWDKFYADMTPLYTAPPQRKPLSDEEIYAIRDAYAWHLKWGIKDFARAIEAAHGIGGKA